MDGAPFDMPGGGMGGPHPGMGGPPPGMGGPPDGPPPDLDVPWDKVIMFCKAGSAALKSEEFQKEMYNAGIGSLKPGQVMGEKQHMQTMEKLTARCQENWRKLGIPWSKARVFHEDPRSVFMSNEFEEGSELEKAFSEYMDIEQDLMQRATLTEEEYKSATESQAQMKKASEALQEMMRDKSEEEQQKIVEGLFHRLSLIQEKLTEYKGDEKKINAYIDGLPWEEQRVPLICQMIQENMMSMGVDPAEALAQGMGPPGMDPPGEGPGADAEEKMAAFAETEEISWGDAAGATGTAEVAVGGWDVAAAANDKGDESDDVPDLD